MKYRSNRGCLLAIACIAAGCKPPVGPTDDGAAQPSTIHTIQGSGDASPITGRRVLVEGLVSGDFQNNDDNPQLDTGGFFLQSLEPDADPATSEGIFVFDGDTPAVDVRAGDRVRVAGVVTEHFGETQIVAETVTMTGKGEIAVVPLSLPQPTTINEDGEPIANLERFEGMLVAIATPMAVTDLRGLERFGEITVSAGGRLRQFTNAHAPGIDAYANYRDSVAGRALIVDDGRSVQNAAPIRFLETARADSSAWSLRTGDMVEGLVGNVRFGRGSASHGAAAFRLMPTRDPKFIATNPRPSMPPDVGGAVRVASFNLLNYFSTVDDGSPACGPAAIEGCRGADSDSEMERQRRKTTTALLAIDAHVIGLMEIENDGGGAAQRIVDDLNAVSTGQWSRVEAGVIGDDAIAVALIYREDVVSLHGTHAVLSSAQDARFNDDKNRPVLAQTFVDSTGGLFTVAVNHLKSKGSPCDDVGDPNIGDGQGNCNRTRTSAAAAEVEWLAADPTASGDRDFLVIGDMNAYLEEDPVHAFEAGGFVNLLRREIGADAYSFVFDGRAGALDHAFASPSLAPRVTGAAEWHINADEAALFDYNLEFDRDPALFEPDLPYRTSDHDPVIIGINP